MLTGLPPFYSNSIEEMETKIRNFELKIPNYLSSAAQDLLKGLLESDPNKRIG